LQFRQPKAQIAGLIMVEVLKVMKSESFIHSYIRVQHNALAN
jgi:hypothetical protein